MNKINQMCISRQSYWQAVTTRSWSNFKCPGMILNIILAFFGRYSQRNSRGPWTILTPQWVFGSGRALVIVGWQSESGGPAHRAAWSIQWVTDTRRGKKSYSDFEDTLPTCLEMTRRRSRPLPTTWWSPSIRWGPRLPIVSEKQR